MGTESGDRLIGRVDLKAERQAGELRVLARHCEDGEEESPASREAMRSAVERDASVLGFAVVH